jgi:hypothetical protein
MLLIDDRVETKTNKFFSQYLSDLFVKKRKLVKLEIDFISQVRSHWETILLDNKTDRVRAEATIAACYQYVGLDRPTIIWAENPINVLKILINRLDLENVATTIIDRMWNVSELEIQNTIDPESTAIVVEKLRYGQLDSAIDFQQLNIFADRMNEVTIDRIAEVYSEVSEDGLPHPLQDYRIGDLSYLDYFMRIGIDIPQVKLLAELAKSCGWCWTFKKVAILTPKPDRVSFDLDGRVTEIVYNDLDILTV